jgi:hypothetical protein
MVLFSLNNFQNFNLLTLVTREQVSGARGIRRPTLAYAQTRPRNKACKIQKHYHNV